MILAILGASLWAVRAGQPEPPEAPNVVIVFADDLGYADVGVFGAEGFSTPNLDRMASEGVRLTDFYVAQPVCSASRAALLTGCYPNRVGIAGALGPGASHGLASEETTLAEVLNGRGYATAIFGKWHLGHHAEFLPTRHGFDEFYGIPYSNDMWPWHPSVAHLPDGVERRKRGYPDLPVFEGEVIADAEVTPEDQERFTSEFTRRAVSFIERHAGGPFFLYLAHPMPHVPLFTSTEFRGVSGQGAFGDAVQEVDWSVGEVLGALERAGVSDRTLVIFTSDNGPWLSYGNHAGSAGPLREGKGTTFEGGVRVPFIARWPGRIPAGSVGGEPAMTIDLLPTIAGIVGAELPERRIDGVDVWALLSGRAGAASPHEALFFYYQSNDLEAVRSGRWKLHFPHGYRTMNGRAVGRDGSPGEYDSSVRTGLELYDLVSDVGETTDVSASHPEVVARLMGLADSMRADLGDGLTGVEGSGRREPQRLPSRP